eukprot:SAG22_NODE_8674_length_637_cov_1.544610_2_plen_20_part_01
MCVHTLTCLDLSHFDLIEFR